MTTQNIHQNSPTDNRIQNVKAHKTIAWLTGVLTLALAVSAFVLSFNALTDLAAEHGISIPPLFPFVVEFAVVIFSLNALFRSLNGESAKVQWLLIIGSSLLAGLFNVAHAQSDPLSRLMAAMPSLFLLLSFESFLNLVKYQVTRDGITTSITALSIEAHDKAQQVTRLNKNIETLEAHLDDLTPNDTNLNTANETRKAQMLARRERVLILTERGVSQADIASELEVSLATVKRDTKALNGRMAL